MFGANAFGWAFFADGFADEHTGPTPVPSTSGLGGTQRRTPRLIDIRRQQEDELLILLSAAL